MLMVFAWIAPWSPALGHRTRLGRSRSARQRDGVGHGLEGLLVLPLARFGCTSVLGDDYQSGSVLDLERTPAGAAGFGGLAQYPVASCVSE